MSPDLRFERTQPGLEAQGDAVQRPWVIVLSDWASNNWLLQQAGDPVGRIDHG